MYFGKNITELVSDRTKPTINKSYDIEKVELKGVNYLGNQTKIFETIVKLFHFNRV